jgi:serine/threonine-protein kinase
MRHATIHRRLETTGPATRRSRGLASELPPELLRIARSRLVLTAFLYAGGYLVLHVAGRLTDTFHIAAQIGPLRIVDVVAAVCVIGSLLFGLVIRRAAIDPERLVDLALVYEFISALGMESYLLLWPTDLPIDSPSISWAHLWVVVFPLLVPTRPAKALLTASCCVLLYPAFLFALRQRGGTVPDGAEIFALIAGLVSVVIAMLAARTVYSLGKDVTRARRLGSYQLVELLGEGGMGEVWRAEHRMLARPAAIKLIRLEALGAEDGLGKLHLLERFEREARLTAALSSANTIQIYDFGTTDDGTFYYVMELLNGIDLHTLVDRHGPVPASRAVHLLVQACESLSEAHAAGLVHRDIKPANLITCRLGTACDWIKVLDFGLVKAHRGEGEAATALTGAHTAAGTPAYMAPEIALGRSDVDGRTDLYALGCVGYWLLTGREVFPSETPMEAIVAHVNSTPEPPSQHSELSIPADLERAVLKCLEKDPNARPQSADELRNLLRDSGAEPWSRDDGRRWWQAHAPDRF